MLSIKRKLSPYKKEQQRFSREYTMLTDRLTDIRSDFDQVTEEDVIDALIYEENAVLARLAQLYKDARAAGISLEPHEHTDFSER